MRQRGARTNAAMAASSAANASTSRPPCHVSSRAMWKPNGPRPISSQISEPVKNVAPPAISRTRTTRRMRDAADAGGVMSRASSSAPPSAAKAEPLALHALQELVHDAAIEILAEIRVLDAGV